MWIQTTLRSFSRGREAFFPLFLLGGGSLSGLGLTVECGQRLCLQSTNRASHHQPVPTALCPPSLGNPGFF